MERKRPAATNGRAMEKLGRDFHCPFTLSPVFAQLIATRIRHALPVEVAGFAFGGVA